MWLFPPAESNSYLHSYQYIYPCSVESTLFVWHFIFCLFKNPFLVWSYMCKLHTKSCSKFIQKKSLNLERYIFEQECIWKASWTNSKTSQTDRSLNTHWSNTSDQLHTNLRKRSKTKVTIQAAAKCINIMAEFINFFVWTIASKPP